jgi:hypothetical protein
VSVYRDGRVHVCREMCPTCIFRPGNLMHLSSGRLREIKDQAIADDTSIICHETYGGPRSVCRGFYDRHQTTPLQVAERLDRIEWT